MFPWQDPSKPLRFDHFMAAALHDPEQGYYSRRIRNIGSRGDFTTTPTLTPALGIAIATWASRALADSACRDLIELGPGTGALAATILGNLPWHRRLRTRLHLVESSRPLRDLQKQQLGTRVHWHATATDALRACQGRACLYSNEFVDAFPVRRLRRSRDGWLELHLAPGNPPVEHWLPLADLPDSTSLTRSWPQNQIIEVHQSYHQWLQHILPHWQCGRMLTIDYGATADRLYHRQPQGSLRAYVHQQLVTGPAIYAHPGQQDLTADVNFTDLQQWPTPRLTTIRQISQHEFLSPHGDPRTPADAFASDPSGAGTAFQVLEQSVQPPPADPPKSPLHSSTSRTTIRP